MPGAILTDLSVEQLQRQYGTLREAVIRYLDGDMPVSQQAALERTVRPEFIAAVAQTRLFQALTGVPR